MAAGAVNRALTMHALAVNGFRKGLMAMPACAFHHLKVKLGDLDIVWVFVGGEIKRVEETVARFHRVLSDEIVRCVAVIAGGRRVVAGLDPAAVLVIHRVAVGAGPGIVRQVGITPGVNKSVSANTKSYANQYHQHELQRRNASHPEISATACFADLQPGSIEILLPHQYTQ